MTIAHADETYYFAEFPQPVLFKSSFQWWWRQSHLAATNRSKKSKEFASALELPVATVALVDETYCFQIVICKNVW